MLRVAFSILILINLQSARADEVTKSPFIELEIEEHEDVSASEEREPASDSDSNDSHSASNAEDGDEQ